MTWINAQKAFVTRDCVICGVRDVVKNNLCEFCRPPKSGRPVYFKSSYKTSGAKGGSLKGIPAKCVNEWCQELVEKNKGLGAWCGECRKVEVVRRMQMLVVDYSESLD